MIYNKLSLNCKNPNIADDELNQYQQTHAVPSKPIVVHDAKLLRRQKSKDAKSVIPATFPVSAKTTKRAVSETVPSVVQPKKTSHQLEMP